MEIADVGFAVLINEEEKLGSLLHSMEGEHSMIEKKDDCYDASSSSSFGKNGEKQYAFSLSEEF
eukprot:7545018-Ditylum_brightwellii.AAC.1